MITIDAGARQVSTTPIILYEVPVPRLRSLLIRNEEAAGGNNLIIGMRGVTATTGMVLTPGETFGISHNDFLPGDHGTFILWGIGSAAATDFSYVAVVE